nr:histidine-rich glycoprotein-like [Nothobranchius furzeri]
MWPNQGPPAYSAVPPPVVYPQATNAGYPAGQYPAPMNPAMGPYATPGGVPYGAPGANAYLVVPSGGFQPGPCPYCTKGDHHKDHKKCKHGGLLPLVGGLAGGLGLGVMLGKHEAHKHDHHECEHHMHEHPMHEHHEIGHHENGHHGFGHHGFGHHKHGHHHHHYYHHH